MGRPRSFRDIVGDEPSGNIPDPPAPEFDSDAMCALAIPGLAESERDRIKHKARELAHNGMSREDVGTWICRQVVRSVGGVAGLAPSDEEVARARAIANSRAGSGRQVKRNKIVERWVERCREVMARHGLSKKEVLETAWRENCILVPRAQGRNSPFRLTYFQATPPLFGRKEGSLPSKRRFQQRLSAGLRSSTPK